MTTRLLGGLAAGFLLVLVTACGGSEPGPPGSSGGPEATVAASVAAGDPSSLTCNKGAADSGEKISIVQHSFPAVTTIAAGTTVTWQDDDTFNHTVTFKNHGPDCDLILIGNAVNITFDQPGEYDYYCKIHSQVMQAKIIVQ